MIGKGKGGVDRWKGGGGSQMEGRRKGGECWLNEGRRKGGERWLNEGRRKGWASGRRNKFFSHS